MTSRIPDWYGGAHGGVNNRQPISRKKPKSLEHQFQKALVATLRRHALIKSWWAVPNGGHRHLFTAMKLKAEGSRRGVADIHFVLPPNGQLACLELKAPKGVLSDEQKQFRDAVRADGALWEHARTFDEAYGILSAWGVLPSSVERKSV